MFQFCVVLVTERRSPYDHLQISQMRAFSARLAVNSQAAAIGVSAAAVARTPDQNQFTKNIRNSRHLLTRRLLRWFLPQHQGLTCTGPGAASGRFLVWRSWWPWSGA